jgi:uncharacterized protein involved in oxidation of intracellular sulfur
LHCSAQQNTVAFSPCESVSAFNKNSSPDLGIVIYSDDTETVWNAIRLANFSISKGDTVAIFVVGKGVDAYMKKQEENDPYNIQKISTIFLNKGGIIYTCATCAKSRHTDDIQSCTITGITDLYEIIKRSKKVVTF